jgi:hypothetical protein
MLAKVQEQTKVYHGDAPPPSKAKLYIQDTFEFGDYEILKEFRGSHPVVMRPRVAAGKRLLPGRNRWLKPAFYRAVLKRGFRG